MTDEQPHSSAGPLTDLHKARIDFARRDLEAARSTDLSATPPASLMLLITRLCTRLEDMIALHGEAVSATPEADDHP